MEPRDFVRRSKRLAYVLRHAPGSIGLRLDEAGWVDVDAMLAALGWTRAELEHVVATNDKHRFALDDTGTRIRASQGHSVAVDLGTPRRSRRRCCSTGRPSGTCLPSRPKVCGRGAGTRYTSVPTWHRPPGRCTARRGGWAGHRPRGGRRGMARDGAVFTRSANGVWLVDAVPPCYLRRI